MVVLAIMGLIISMATPRLVKMYDAVQFSLEKDDIMFQLSMLANKVYLQGKNLTLKDILEDKSTGFLSLPADWQILNTNNTSSIQYSQFGFCNGGEVRLMRNGKPLNLFLKPPLCAPQVIQ